MSSWSRWSWWRRLAVAGASVAAPALGCMLAAAAPALADEPPAKPSVAPAAFREQETKLPAPPPLAPEPTTIASPREPAPAPPPLPAEPSGSPADRQRWLAAKIDEILARPSLANAKVGVLVAEVDGGRTLYARNERALLNPASNAKLVTTAAALGLLGPEYRFKTGLWVDSYKSGEVNGNLYLKGSGDPAFVIEDLWKLVADLASQGVKRGTGAIAVDDTFFDEVRIGPAFEQKDEDAPFRAPAGAVSLNYNACTVHVLPTRDGQPPRVLVEPASPYR